MENTAAEIIRQKAEEETTEIIVEKNAEDKYIVGALYNDRVYYFNSRYSDNDMTDIWVNQISAAHYSTVALVFGLANGEYIRALRKTNSDMIIIAVEPSYSVASVCLDTIGIDDLCSDEKCVICIGDDNYALLDKYINEYVSYERIKYTKFLVAPNYENIFPEQVKKVRELLLNCINRLCIDRNTFFKYGTEMRNNVAENIDDYIEQYNLSDLIGKFKNTDVSDIPAIIVAAGPSLDKNVGLLKNISANGFIIATDSSLNTLSRENIIPDIAVTIDPHKPLSLFEKENMMYVPLIYSLTANSKIRNLHRGKRIYTSEHDAVVIKYAEKYGNSRTALATGGSVACDAFSLAYALGFKTVIFIGLDLAYTNDKTYAGSTYSDRKKTEADYSQNSDYIEVEDIYGNMVRTIGNLDWYRQWFEEAVLKYSDVAFIDATEGGAKKKGMEIMTLDEALKKYCKSNKNIDFAQIINSMDTAYTQEQQHEIWKDLSEFSECMRAMREKIHEGNKAYDELDALNRKQKYSGKHFKETIEKISEINNWINTDSTVLSLYDYVVKEEYEVKEEVYEEQKNNYEDFKIIVKNGKKMLETYMDATYMIEEDMKPVVNKAKEKIKIGEV